MRERGCFYKLALVFVGALLLVGLWASSALAATCETRVQAVDREVCPYVSMQVPASVTVPVVGGGTLQTTFPNPLAALYLTSVQRGFAIEASATDLGAFLEKIAGYGDPIGWSNWWLFAVNGFSSPLGADAVESRDGDQYLWLNVPGTAPWSNLALIVRGPATIPLGQQAAFTVVGDDLDLVNSEADIARFGLDPATTTVQTPAQFPAVEGATVHASGVDKVTGADGKVTVAATAPGTYSIWAEKAYDETYYYVPSTRATTFTVPFSDVPSTSPYYKAIHKIAGKGIVGGYEITPTEVEYRPGNDVLRAQYVKMISLALGLEVDEAMPAPVQFPDLGEDDPANLYPHQYVYAAYANDITTGYLDGTFKPWGPINRAQVITMTVRAIQKLQPAALTAVPAGFSLSWGAGLPDVHEGNVKIAESNGLLDGLDLAGRKADAWAPMSRGETAQIMANMLDLLQR